MIEDEIKKISEQYNIVKVFNCENYANDPLKFYGDIHSIRKDAFDNDEKIVFILASDYYKSNTERQIGQFLTLIQKFCNDIDISNFFVTIITTNNLVFEEYDWIYNNENFDNVRFNIIECPGDFTRYSFNEKLVYSGIENYKDLINKISDKNSTAKEFIFNSKSFCTLAWHGINLEPDGKIRICCESDEVLGDSSERTIEEIYNSKKLQDTRSLMLKNKKISSCQSCYTKEKYGRDSLRKSSNRKFFHTIDEIIKNTTEYGKYNKFDLKYIDARYNNLCNLACRSCNPRASSSWYKASVFLDKDFSNKQPNAFLIAGQDQDDIYNQILKHTDTIETIYFAGGEPLIIEKFYDILEHLIDNGRSDVELIYNSNMTHTKLKSRKIFDLWNKFPNVSVGASLDAAGRRAEYVRTNTKWDTIEKNRKLMMKECPHVDFHVSATTGILNALHVPDFHYSWVQKGLIKPEEFNIQILFSPEHYSLKQAPKNMKIMIEKKYLDHLKWLRPLDKNGRATFGYESVIEHMKSNEEFDKTTFWKETDLLDKFYKQDLLDYIPELSILPR